MLVDGFGGVWLSAPLALGLGVGLLCMVIWADRGLPRPARRAARLAPRSGSSGNAARLAGRAARPLPARPRLSLVEPPDSRRVA